jgi:regulator of sigma E protease
MTIVLGLVALSVLVVIHETGHFLAARLCGVTVESFSVGMGPILLHKTIKGVDYRLSLIPFGGYRGLKGEKDFQNALEEKRDYFTSDPQSMFGTKPIKRLCIAVMGPVFNFVFAIFAFTLIALMGYTYYSADNRIILADEVYPNMLSAAREQGLKTGDRILFLNDESIETFSDISRFISTHPDEDIAAVIERNGARVDLTLRPALDKNSAMGKIGVVNWIDPVLASVESGSASEKAGLKKGDIIVEVNGKKVNSTAEVFALLSGETALITFERRDEVGSVTKSTASLALAEDGASPLVFSVPARRAKTYSLFPALGQGTLETARTLALTLKSIGFLFKGADVTQAVSGPVRITVMLGDTVKSGFGAGINAGVVRVFNLLALISVSLFLMNLLPVPVLDGGTVLFSLVEIVMRKPLKPKFLYYIQFVGIAFIGALLILALFSDTRYLLFTRK